jgi:hypothetical protein
MNSNNSGSSKDLINRNTPTIKRRNFFFYLAAGAAGVYAFTKMPFNIFKSKVASASRIQVKANPYAVKREAKGVNNG